MEGVEFDKKMLGILRGYNDALKHMVEQIEFLSKRQADMEEATEKVLIKMVDKIDDLNDRCSNLENCIGRRNKE